MSTFTAQILIGEPHPYHDGINPTHYLFLSENSRPAWILTEQNVLTRTKSSNSRIVWIPTIENMLDDGLLMVALFVCKNQELIDLMETFNADYRNDLFEIYSNLDKEQRDVLYQKCRRISDYPKMILSIFKGSSLRRRLQVIEEYKMDVEICSSTYSRISSHGTGEVETNGSITRNR